jgi:hypothetical protein
MPRIAPAACLLLALAACRSDTDIVPGKDPGGDSAAPADTGGDCADAEVPYNGVDDDCDPATPDDDLDGDGSAVAEDCDDDDPAVHPGATEECNGVDDDCDGVTDPTTAWWTDADGDGFGGAGGEDCEPPEGSVSQGGDCDDADAAVHPDATEVCNGIDDDCDGAVDGVAEGYGDLEVCPAVDCADLLAVRPGAPDGVYWLGEDSDPGTDAYEARCDMQTDGGGWTLVLAMNAARMTQYDASDVLESQRSVGVVGDENHLSEGFYRVVFAESYVVDATHGVPVVSDVVWAGGAVGADIVAQLSGAPAAPALWSHGARSRLLLRSTPTTDDVFALGDMRVHFIVNQGDAPDLAFPVSTSYRTGERHLVFDSDFGHAGGRVYDEPLYDISGVGLDEGFAFYVR